MNKEKKLYVWKEFWTECRFFLSSFSTCYYLGAIIFVAYILFNYVTLCRGQVNCLSLILSSLKNTCFIEIFFFNIFPRSFLKTPCCFKTNVCCITFLKKTYCSSILLHACCLLFYMPPPLICLTSDRMYLYYSHDIF